MNFEHFEPHITANSTLNVRASGSINDEILQDLFLENGKSIAELLDDQEKKDNQETNK